MVDGEDWLFHSALSQYLNCGLLTPREVCEAVLDANTKRDMPLNSVEGFIRQILGWREFVRGIYWLRMPEYAGLNRLGNKRHLPAFYWTGETDMRCMAHSLGQTRREALSHHIQRLMVTGNFALLAGVIPEEICAWYLAVYADAFEWVELPNTLGMVMHADGGLLGSKPYAASGNYIDKMSNFCGSCRYRVKEKLGPDACPFNYLYWNFMIEHEQQLRRNPRMGPIFKTLERMSSDRRDAVVAEATAFLDGLEPCRPEGLPMSRRVWIIGASYGIGAALAERLAEDGRRSGPAPAAPTSSRPSRPATPGRIRPCRSTSPTGPPWPRRCRRSRPPAGRPTSWCSMPAPISPSPPGTSRPTI
jgi:deoxyribodipyrimidine photolyase-related protein